jgi:hypothetical protein
MIEALLLLTGMALGYGFARYRRKAIRSEYEYAMSPVVDHEDAARRVS